MLSAARTSTPTTLTLDTNLLWVLWKDRPKAGYVEDLLELHRNGRVELAVTNRIHADIPDEPWAGRLKEELDKLDIVPIGSVFRLGYSRLGEDRFACEQFLQMMFSIRDRRAPIDPKLPGSIDWEHLHGHHLANRDVFLTWDKPVLRLASELCTRLELTVMAPEEFLKRHRHQRQ